MSARAKHADVCDCKRGETFVCNVCKRRVGWCLGASDDMPDACDDCWYEANVVVVGYVVAFPDCKHDDDCRLVWAWSLGEYYRSALVGGYEVAVWATRSDAVRAARAFLGASKERFSVRRVVRRATPCAADASRRGRLGLVPPGAPR